MASALNLYFGWDKIMIIVTFIGILHEYMEDLLGIRREFDG